jgi:uncharacterized protein with PQ loop repeat
VSLTFLTPLALPLAYTGAALGVAMVIPQIARTLRHPSLSGVSALSWALTALGCSAWLIYGVRAQVWPQIPGNVLLISGAVAIVLLVPSAVSRRRRAAFLLGAWSVLATVALTLPAHSVGYLGFGIGLVAVWPQVRESVIGWRSGSESGLSITTWSLKAMSQLCWLSYALLATDVPVAFSASVALATTVFVATLEASRRFPVLRRLPLLDPA